MAKLVGNTNFGGRKDTKKEHLVKISANISKLNISPPKRSL
jgi:hypothetical protein